MLLHVIIICFFIGYVFLIGFYYRWWRRLPLFDHTPSESLSFISVVVAARNEADAISQLLHSLKQQTYPQHSFEILIVDDFSTDATPEIVRAFGLKNVKLLQPSVESNFSSKKKAIETGIATAAGELIVTTDADCVMGKDWLQVLNSFYKKTNACFIAAPVQYLPANQLLQIFQTLDFITLQGITAASVAAQFHTMCNGANLAYTRKAFYAVNGFQGIDQVASGDDMLLMHKIWKAQPEGVVYLKNKQAIVRTAPMQNWKAFINQRKRWGSKTLVYDDYRILLVLGFVYCFNLLFFALIIAALFQPYYWITVVLYLFFKTGIEIPFVYSVARFFDQQHLLRYFFLFQPLHITYTVFVGFISQLGRYEWKGRKTK